MLTSALNPQTTGDPVSQKELDLASRVRGQLDSLLFWAKLPQESGERFTSIFDLLTRESLAQPLEPPFGGLSRINANGLPFQCVLRFGKNQASLGFLCEIGKPGTTPQQRLHLSLERLATACDAVEIKRPDWFTSILAHLLPNPDENWPEHWQSAMWVGVSASKTGVQLKPYFNLNRGTARERWLRAGWILKTLGRENSIERLCRLSRCASEHSWPVGLAVDILPDGSAGRVKVYFRSEAVPITWLEKWYQAAGYEQHVGIVRRFLDLFPWFGRQPYPQGAFIVSVEFHPEDGILSLKTDFGVTKWLSSDKGIAIATSGLLSAINCEPTYLQCALAALGIWQGAAEATTALRFVGLGSEPDGSCHVNLYVEPPLRVTRQPALAARQKKPVDPVAAGLWFLMSKRREAHWSDFSLPVGESHAWVTAYVLTRLSELKRKRIPERNLQEIEESLDWLLASRTPQGGWGYNATVEDDVDSTSWAILALRGHGRKVPQQALELIRRCARRNGATSTYPASPSAESAWGLIIPDVTAVAVNALAKTSIAKLEALFGHWLQEDGTFPAYWWASPLYTCATVLDWPADVTTSPLLTRLKRRLPRYQAQNPFEEALQLRCLVRFRLESAAAVAARLASAQNSDGSWSSSAILRLTRPQVIEPWNTIDAGPLYLDHNRIFTTVTALASLAHYFDTFAGGSRS